MTLRYPAEVSASGTDTVVFTHHEYKANRNAGPPTRREGNQVILYVPNSTPTPSNANNWGDFSLAGPLGNLRMDAASEAAKLVQDLKVDDFRSIDALKNLGSRVGQSAGNFFNSAKDNGAGALRQLGTDAAAGLAGMNSASQLLAVSRGEIYNPNVELLYRGPSLRSFSFAYTFLPKSEQEANMVNQIIMEFKKWSAPEETDSGMFKVPHVWEVKYMTNGKQNPNMNDFKRAALTSVSVAHNPGLDMHATFPNGMPIVTSMTLGFQEVDVITRNDHETSDSNIGY